MQEVVVQQNELDLVKQWCQSRYEMLVKAGFTRGSCSVPQELSRVPWVNSENAKYGKTEVQLNDEYSGTADDKKSVLYFPDAKAVCLYGCVLAEGKPNWGYLTVKVGMKLVEAD